MSLRDLLREAASGVLARPARAALTVLGTVLGVAALVATLGLSSSASNAVNARFDELRATEVTVVPSEFAQRAKLVDVLPWDAEQRLRRLNGIEESGTLAQVDVGALSVRRVALRDPSRSGEVRLPVLAASPGLLRAAGATFSHGRSFDAGHSARADRVVLLGQGAAAALGVQSLDGTSAVLVGDVAYSVVGVVQDVRRRPEVLGAVVLPAGTAVRDFALRAPETVLVQVAVGAADLIVRQAPLALAPERPAALRATRPPEPASTQQGIQEELTYLFLVLGGVSLVLGAVGIVNVTLVSVMERVGEIGLRRALGAGRRHVAGQFLVESGVLGFAGGVVGASLGVLVLVGVCLTRGWQPVLDLWLPLCAPVVGGLVGVLAGGYPAWRAAALPPAEALRISA